MAFYDDWTWWQVLLAVAGVFALVFMVISSMTVVSLSKPDFQLLRIQDPDLIRKLEDASNYDEWAIANGFARVGCFETRQIVFAKLYMDIWQHRERSTLLCLNYVTSSVETKVNYEFVSLLTRDVVCDTGNARDAHIFPRPPGHYSQTFAGRPIDELWAEHQVAERFLASACLVQLQPQAGDVALSFKACIDRQMTYVRSLPLWFCRGLWWFVVRPLRYHGKTIEQQHLGGLLRMIHEV